MLKRGTLLVLLVTFCVWTYGATITRGRAAQLAQEFLSQRSAIAHAGAAHARAVGIPLEPLDIECSDYYIFNRGTAQGFVIVAADDRAEEPVLGYADEGTLDMGNLPCGLEQLLEVYSHYISGLRELEDTSAAAARRHAPARQAVEPIVQVHWHQNNPYNWRTPKGYVPAGAYRCAVGCLAVAMAQAMSVYRSPDAVKATIPGYQNKTTWTSSKGEETATLASVPAGKKIDWKYMLDRYNGNESVVQIEAIANLMLYCGTSVNTNYDATSGAATAKAPDALKKYFGYGQVTYYDSDRLSYSQDEWESLVYDELAAGRPVIMAGQTSMNLAVAEGHAFICDGYDGNGKFHVNWGWDNGSDGFFLLTNLNPPRQGTGGSNSAFNYHQEIITGIVPNDYKPTTPDTPLPTTSPTKEEIASLESSLSEMETLLVVERAACQEYYGKFLAMNQRVQELEQQNEALINDVTRLQNALANDDKYEYYYLLLEGCLTAMNGQIVPKLEAAKDSVTNMMETCFMTADQLTTLQTSLSGLALQVSATSTRVAYNEVKTGIDDAYSLLNALVCSGILNVKYQMLDSQLLNVGSLRDQVQAYYNSVEQALGSIATGVSATRDMPSAECYDLSGRRLTDASCRQVKGLRVERQKDGQVRKRINR